MTTCGGPVLLTTGERAEFWLDLVAALHAEPLRTMPHEPIAQALTRTFAATATAVHERGPGWVRQVVHTPDGDASRFEAANDFAATRAATEHPLLAYYLATGDARAHDTDAVPLVVPASRAWVWREEAAAVAAERQIALPVEHTVAHQRYYVVGRSPGFDPEDVHFARRLQPLLQGLSRQACALRHAAPEALARAGEVALTPRETAVLTGIADGLTAEAVGRRLAISPRTVHKHLERAYTKLGVGDRVSAVLRAGRLGILDRTALAS